jgi:hypothetical protein
VIPVIFHELISEFAAIEILRASGEGIYSERAQGFSVELQNLMETIETRDQEPEQMNIYNYEDVDAH